MPGLVARRNGKVLSSGELPGVFNDLQNALKTEEARGVELKNGDATNSGCSAVLAVMTPTRSLRGAWLGDCVCVAGYRDLTSGTCRAKVLSPPHLATNPPRITSAFGLFSHAGLGREAGEYVEADIDLEGIDFLIVGSGGLWNGIDAKSAVQVVAEAGPYHSQYACFKLVGLSQSNKFAEVGAHQVEDATALVMWIAANVNPEDKIDRRQTK